MVYRFHDYTLDPAGRELRHGAHRLALEPKVFQVLLYLLEHRDRVVSKTELLEQCWPKTFVSESALTRCLTRLRKAVQPTPTAPPVIETLHRQGYRFVAAVTVLAQPPASAPVDTALPPAPPLLQATAHPMLPVAPATPAPSAPPSSVPLAALPVRLASSGAERRQLTVLFCDVVDSTTLAGRLDLEDFREVMMRYHATCTEVIQRYGGQIAQYLGNGLLVYFGWPQAHEDDARRAVHAGLALLTAVHDLEGEPVRAYGLRLAIRIGVHTGLVVVGDMAGGPSYGQLAVGATPNLAAKIQGLAAPDTVVISDTTSHLVQGYFDCASLGEHTLPGMTEPCILYQVLYASGAHGRLDVTPPPQRTPFVGREAELAVLRERATQVQQGQGQVVLLSGDAGIGKSRLVQEIKTAMTADGFTAMEFRCSPYYQHTALHPVVEWLQRILQFDGDTPVPARIERLEQLLQQVRLDLQEHLPLLASLLSLDLPPERYPVRQLSPQRQRQYTLDTLIALVLACTERQQVLLIVEDLHWLDPTTLEWLGMVIDQGPTAPLLTLMTTRPTFVSPWGGRTHVTLLTVSRLASQQVTQLVQWLGGDQLSAVQLQHIVTQTDGVPLFVEEVTKFVLAAHRLQGNSGGPASAHTAPEVPIPATLRDSLMARLDQLGPAKGTAQLGATMGREFPYALLQAITPLDEDLLRQDLKQLVKAELLYQRGVGATAVYQFKHALVQEAAYASLLRRTRQQYHRHIAQVLEARFSDIVETQPELLAQHYTEAGLYEQAIGYWQRAGQRANGRSAYREAMSHLTKGLAVLETLPETLERTQHELDLQMILGPALMALKGWSAPEVEQAYARAQALCQQVGQTPQRFHVLAGLVAFHVVRGELQTAQRLAEQGTTVAKSLQDPACLLLAQGMLGMSLFYRGALPSSRASLEDALARYDPSQHHRLTAFGIDPGELCLAHGAQTLLFLGYPEQALQRASEAITLAQQLSHPFSLAMALGVAAWIHWWRGEIPLAQKQAEAMITLSTDQGFPHWLAQGTVLRGCALVAQGQGEGGIAHLRQGIASHRTTGAGLLWPLYLPLLAEAYGKVEQAAAGLPFVDEALAMLTKNDERVWEAELYRIKGELLLAFPTAPHAEAETWLRHAIQTARQQQAKAWELRATLRLGRLLQKQGQQAEARQMLAAIYDWFTEGFETADLREAQALLDQWA